MELDASTLPCIDSRRSTVAIAGPTTVLVYGVRSTVPLSEPWPWTRSVDFRPPRDS